MDGYMDKEKETKEKENDKKVFAFMIYKYYFT